MIHLITANRELWEHEKVKNSNLNELEDFIEENEIIEVDTETGLCPWNDKRTADPFTAELKMIQIGTPKDQFVIYDYQQFPKLIDILKELFSCNKIKLLQNAKFDLRFFMYLGIDDYNNIYDTMLVEKCITRGLGSSASLQALAFKYLNEGISKAERTNITYSLSSILYGAKDVTLLTPIREAQMEKVREMNLEKYIELENRYVVNLARVEFNGVGIDQEKWKNVEVENTNHLIETKAKIAELLMNTPYGETGLFGNELKVNLGSPKQVAELFKFLNIELLDKDDKPTTDIKYLQKIIGELDGTAKEFAKLYIDYKETNKERTTYGSKFLKQSVNPSTGRIHSEFYQILDTGRISSSKPNLQNIPGEVNDETHPLRKAFTPGEDNLFIVADYSQQEPYEINVVFSCF